MATYVTLYNFTEQGLKTIKDTVKRTEAAKKAGKRDEGQGGTLGARTIRLGRHLRVF